MNSGAIVAQIMTRWLLDGSSPAAAKRAAMAGHAAARAAEAADRSRAYVRNTRVWCSHCGSVGSPGHGITWNSAYRTVKAGGPATKNAVSGAVSRWTALVRLAFSLSTNVMAQRAYAMLAPAQRTISPRGRSGGATNAIAPAVAAALAAMNSGRSRNAAALCHRPAAMLSRRAVSRTVCVRVTAGPG